MEGGRPAVAAGFRASGGTRMSRTSRASRPRPSHIRRRSREAAEDVLLVGRAIHPDLHHALHVGLAVSDVLGGTTVSVALPSIRRNGDEPSLPRGPSSRARPCRGHALRGGLEPGVALTGGRSASLRSRLCASTTAAIRSARSEPVSALGSASLGLVHRGPRRDRNATRVTRRERHASRPDPVPSRRWLGGQRLRRRRLPIS